MNRNPLHSCLAFSSLLISDMLFHGYALKVASPPLLPIRTRPPLKTCTTLAMAKSMLPCVAFFSSWPCVV